MPPAIDVVIPTKSNFDGLFNLVSQLEIDNSVKTVVVVCDGENAISAISGNLPPKAVVLMAELSIGIHKMWNIGIEYLVQNDSIANGNHVAFINDDVSLSGECMSKMCSVLDSDKSIGLVTPSWTDEVNEYFIPSTAFAGFCMCVRSELINEWRFDERMKWWYGDNDIISWVTCDKDMQTGISGIGKAIGNKSHTITNDPPTNFHNLIHEDARIYHEKWDAKIAAKNSLTS